MNIGLIFLGNKEIEEVKRFVKNPIKIAITGKIGSGKSTVADIIKDLGYFVFESDKEVDKLFNSNNIKNKIKTLFVKLKTLLIKMARSIRLF